MSLDKAIKHGKEHRKPYSGSKAIDKTCRNHGGCPWCEENRLHKFRDKHPEFETERLNDALTFLKEKETVTVHDPGGFCPECSWVLGPGERPLTFVGEDDV